MQIEISTSKLFACVIAALLLGFSSIFYSSVDEQKLQQTQQEASADIAPSDAIDVAYIGE